jgi:hypothetical protein
MLLLLATFGYIMHASAATGFGIPGVQPMQPQLAPNYNQMIVRNCQSKTREGEILRQEDPLSKNLECRRELMNKIKKANDEADKAAARTFTQAMEHKDRRICVRKTEQGGSPECVFNKFVDKLKNKPAYRVDIQGNTVSLRGPDNKPIAIKIFKNMQIIKRPLEPIDEESSVLTDPQNEKVFNGLGQLIEEKGESPKQPEECPPCPTETGKLVESVSSACDMGCGRGTLALLRNITTIDGQTQGQDGKQQTVKHAMKVA